ncbi:uncharacterized protein N0V89_004251 [Didymosphaeria variabile]|uniref:Uncharacterized protein n=1 Tax=Didymosphaeria variabile TaxID=1932322 RepID=A0A9W8XQT8_9PLEO|nr:uncharacterized protein N0V89_004251 [Didymosphaeria variabile]KAJ4356221.1 hypothetical protein N0V89_004251 [Didymosphaeria variabile]
MLELAARRDQEENERLAIERGKLVNTATHNRKEFEQLASNNRQLAEENKKLQNGDLLCDRAWRMIERRDENIQDLQEEAAARKKTIKDMGKVAKAKEKGISDYEADTLRLKQTIASVQQMRDEMVAQRDNTITDLEQDIATKDETVTALSQAVSKLEDTAAANKNSISDLGQEVIAREQEYTDLQASSGKMVAQAEVTITQLKEDAAQMVTTITNLKQEATAKETNVAKLIQKHSRIRRSLRRSLKEVAPDETDSDTEDTQVAQSRREDRIAKLETEEEARNKKMTETVEEQYGKLKENLNNGGVSNLKAGRG